MHRPGPGPLPPANGSSPMNMLEQREHLHQQLLSSVSHDLKTPLASIIGSLEIYFKMADKLAPEKKNALLRTAMQEAYRLDSFITNILDLAKIEGQSVKVRHEEFNLTSLLRDATRHLGSLADKASVTLETTTPVPVRTDSVLVGRVVSLLLDNAIKYSRPRPEVVLRAGSHGNVVFVQILDNGPGIPPDKREEIFNKFTRLNKRDHQVAGTGLGLSIARGMAQLLGGDIDIDTRPEGGSLFTFTFLRE